MTERQTLTFPRRYDDPFKPSLLIGTRESDTQPPQVIALVGTYHNNDPTSDVGDDQAEVIKAACDLVSTVAKTRAALGSNTLQLLGLYEPPLQFSQRILDEICEDPQKATGKYGETASLVAHIHQAGGEVRSPEASLAYQMKHLHESLERTPLDIDLGDKPLASAALVRYYLLIRLDRQYVNGMRAYKDSSPRDEQLNLGSFKEYAEIRLRDIGAIDDTNRDSFFEAAEYVHKSLFGDMPLAPAEMVNGQYIEHRDPEECRLRIYPYQEGIVREHDYTVLQPESIFLGTDITQTSSGTFSIKDFASLTPTEPCIMRFCGQCSKSDFAWTSYTKP